MISVLRSQAVRYADRSVLNETEGSTCMERVPPGFASSDVPIEDVAAALDGEPSLRTRVLESHRRRLQEHLETTRQLIDLLDQVIRTEQLALTSTSSSPAARAKIGFGIADVDDVWERATAHGVTEIAAPNDSGYMPRSAVFSDPAGNRVQRYQRSGGW
jgi:hypothetical protein